MWRAKHTNEGCDVRAICMLHTAQESQNTPNAFHSWWQQDQLLRWGSHTNSWDAGFQITLQQCDINTWSTLHDNGHCKLLLDDPPQMPGIHQNQTEGYTGGNHPKIQNTWPRNARGQRIHQSNQSHAQATLCRPPCQQTTRSAAEQTHLLAKKIGARFVETQYKAHIFHASYQQLWREVHKTRDVDNLKTTLEHNYSVTVDWMGKRYIGITLDWDYEQKRVHLSMPNCVKKALQLFQHKNTTGTTRTTSMHPNCIWSQSTIRKASSKITNSWLQNQEIYRTSLQKISIPRLSGRQHSSVPNQRHCIAIGKFYRRYVRTDLPPNWLPGNTKRRGTNIQREQHGTCSA